MSSFEGLYNIRSAKAEDINFILATWLRGLYYGESWFKEIPKNIFMNNYKKIAQVTLMSPKVEVRVACLKEDDDVILGYSVISRNQEAIIWVFTKTAWRKQGICRSLIPHSAKYATHLTALGKTLMPKLPNAVFNPFY